MVVTLSELGWFLKACFLHEEIDSKRLRSVQGQISVHSIVVPEEFSLPTFYHSLMLFHSNSKPEPYVFRKKKCDLHPNPPSVALLQVFIISQPYFLSHLPRPYSYHAWEVKWV